MTTMKEISERITELMQELNMDTKDDILVRKIRVIYYQARLDQIDKDLKQLKTKK